MRQIPKIKFDLQNPQNLGNAAKLLHEDERRTLASDLVELISVDKTSMEPWLGKAQGYLDKLDSDENEHPQDREQEGAAEEPPPKTEMTLSAVIQFSARAADAILGEPDIAMASEPDEGAQELAKWVSSQLRTADQNWQTDTDPLTVHMAVTGLAWRKRDFDDIDQVFHSHFVPCTKVYVNNSVETIERAPRITHHFDRYPYEIERSIQRGKWIDYKPRFDDEDPQAPKEFYECDAWLDLDDDGINEPWTFTIAMDDTLEIVRIRPRWSKKTVIVNTDAVIFNAIRRFYPYRFMPDPKGGFLPIGFGRILDRAEASADMLLGAITDTAKSESENGGVYGGSRFGLPDKIELKNNRATSIPTDGQPLDQVFKPFPVKSVSPGSVAVLEKVMTLADRLAGTLNLLENAPASMSATMARGIIDTGSKIQSAVHRRMCGSLTQEIRMFVQMADAYDALPEGLQSSSRDGIAITADPQLATEMQRAALTGFYLELLQVPGLVVPKVLLRALQTARIPKPEELIAPPQEAQPTPYERVQGLIGMQKAQTEKIKAVSKAAVDLTQALLNMTEASGGMVNNRLAMLQMAQLEHAVADMIQGQHDANGLASGMAQQAGNPNAGNLPAPAVDAGNGQVPNGPTAQPSIAG